MIDSALKAVKSVCDTVNVFYSTEILISRYVVFFCDEGC